MSAVGSDASSGLGQALREARDKAGWTLRRLAEALDLSPAFLSDVEHGRRGMSQLAQAAKLLGTTEHALLARSEVVTRSEVEWLNAHPEILKLLRLRRHRCDCSRCAGGRTPGDAK